MKLSWLTRVVESADELGRPYVDIGEFNGVEPGAVTNFFLYRYAININVDLICIAQKIASCYISNYNMKLFAVQCLYMYKYFAF